MYDPEVAAEGCPACNEEHWRDDAACARCSDSDSPNSGGGGGCRLVAQAHRVAAAELVVEYNQLPLHLVYHAGRPFVVVR